VGDDLEPTLGYASEAADRWDLFAKGESFPIDRDDSDLDREPVAARPTTGPALAALATTLLVVVVIVLQAWPPSSEHVLSSEAAARACESIAARHRGKAYISAGASYAEVSGTDQGMHLGLDSFLASVPKSKGVAGCVVVESDLRPCLHDGPFQGKASLVWATPDATRYVVVCRNVGDRFSFSLPDLST
jgi:hypothetical protein